MAQHEVLPLRSAEEEAGKRFLERFPASVRGSLGGLFHHCVRTGAATPEEVVRRVAADAAAAAQAPYADPSRRENLRLLLAGLRDDPGAAAAYASWCLWWDTLPKDERQARKQDRAEAGRRSWMEQQEPTAAQIKYLAGLGHQGPVANRAEASRLIDELRQLKAGAAR
jgi:hypothetical protein